MSVHTQPLIAARDALALTLGEINRAIELAETETPAGELPEPKWRRDDDVCGERWFYKAKGSPDIAYVVQRGNSFGWNFYAHLASGEHRCGSADEAKRAVESAWAALPDAAKLAMGLPPKEEPLPTLASCCGTVPQERGQYIVVCQTCGKAVERPTRREAFEAWNAKEEPLPEPVKCVCGKAPEIIPFAEKTAFAIRCKPCQLIVKGDSIAEAATRWNEMQAELAAKAVVKDSLTTQPNIAALERAVVEAAETWQSSQKYKPWDESMARFKLERVIDALIAARGGLA